MTKSLFREISLKVHPDMSTHSASASVSRMQEVLKYKDCPDILLKMAHSWGLNIDYSKYESEDVKVEPETIFNAIVGALVVTSVPMKNNRIYNLRGVIAKIRDIKSGRYKGGYEFTIYDVNTLKFMTVKTFQDNPFDNVIGMAGDAMNQVRRAMINSNINPGHGNKTTYEIFRDFGLFRCHDYSSENVKVKGFYKGRFHWFTIQRTTAKMIYTKEGCNININNIVEVEK